MSIRPPNGRLEAPTLNPVLHQPLRTRIAAYLAARGEATFSELKRAIEITDGNLEAHMKKLVGAGYIEARREAGDGRPQTFYELSGAGRAAFRAYVAALQALLELGGNRGGMR
jgi:predicted ArsR family transcriptional regulator